MSTHGQLEIIKSNGQIEFFTLDPGKGITNIGRHPENDVVLSSPGVAPFHAMLDHRQKPYQIMLLAQDGRTFVGGEALLPNVSKAVHSWTNIQLDGFTIVVVDSSGQHPAAGRTGGYPAASPSYQPQPQGYGYAPPPISRPETPSDPATYGFADASRGYGAPAAAAAAGYYYAGQDAMPVDAMPPPRFPVGPMGPVEDVVDNVILVEMIERGQIVDVSQTANYQFTLINGGDIVAMFIVEVLGVDQEWVAVSPPNVNLYEGDRTPVNVSITPPRSPQSRSGVHNITIKVSSPNYPGRVSQLACTVTINPFYEFSVGELTPKQQTMSWFRRTGQVGLTVYNQGNSPAVFHLEAEDDERACNFEFYVPGEPVGRVKQADMRLQPDSYVSLPVDLTPRSRQLFGFRKRRFSYTITTNLPESNQTARTLLGQLSTKALLGPWIIMLMALLLALLIVWIFIPRIRTFNSDGSQTKVITSGETITLRWNASALSNLKVNPVLGDVDGPVGTATVMPTADVVYELRAENWLSRLAPSLFIASAEVRVFVTPVPPEIRFFEIDTHQIVLGEEVNLSWHVTSADDLILETNGLPQTLTEHAGTLTDSPDRETNYTLVAINQYKTERGSQTVIVAPPTATPVPTPVVRKFVVNPPVIIAGESVTIEWEVEGADDVAVAPLGAGLPAIQSVVQSPLETTNYILNASKGPARIDPMARVVFVTPAPTGTPEPDAPTITFFVGDPQNLISGKSPDEPIENLVTLTWSVKGTTTNVEISGPSLGSPISNLQPADSINVTVDETTLFVLTAFNQDKKSSANVQITVDGATPTPSATVPPTPLPTATVTPIPAIIDRFVIASPNSSPPVTDKGGGVYEVMVNTEVTFEWQINSATVKTTFTTQTPADGSVSEEAVGTSIKKTITGVGPNFYRLVAENAEGTKDQADIQVIVVNQLAPSAPTSVLGQETPADNNRITWNWSNSSSLQSDIVGFRVYRANVPGGSFSTIADEGTLDKDAREYVDSIFPTCGRAYYVVAVYRKIDGSLNESAVSTNSWYSALCP